MTNHTDRACRVRIVLGVAVLALAPAVGRSQSPQEEIKALWAEILQLKQSQQALHKDIAAMRQQAAPTPPPPFPGAEIPISAAAVLGSKDARVTVVEFVDYQCPFCRMNFQNTLPRLIEDYVETGKLRYVTLDYPLESIHSHAFGAAVAARCAGGQGKHWEMHDKLFSNQKELDAGRLPSYARELGLNEQVFLSCLKNGSEAGKVRADLELGQKAGITGTPAFLLGLTDPGNPGLLKATRKISGAQPYSVFKAAIDSLLDPAEQSESLVKNSLQ